MTTDITIRAMRADDWPAVREIYEAGIATGHATFETNAPTWEHWDHTHLAEHRLTATVGGEVTGWAALSPVSDRGTRERIGQLNGVWRDTLVLERRSRIVG